MKLKVKGHPTARELFILLNLLWRFIELCLKEVCTNSFIIAIAWRFVTTDWRHQVKESGAINTTAEAVNK